MGLKNAICGMTGLLCDQYKNTSGTGPANKVAEEKAQLAQQPQEAHSSERVGLIRATGDAYNVNGGAMAQRMKAAGLEQ